MANYYNSNGKKTGCSSKGLFGTTNYYGFDGRKKGYSSQGLFGTTNYYGSDGRKKGYSSNGSFGTRNYYDSSGRKTGYSSKRRVTNPKVGGNPIESERQTANAVCLSIILCSLMALTIPEPY